MIVQVALLLTLFGGGFLWDATATGRTKAAAVAMLLASIALALLSWEVIDSDIYAGHPVEPGWEVPGSLVSGVPGMAFGIAMACAGLRIVARRRMVTVPGDDFKLLIRGYWAYVVGFLLYLAGAILEGLGCLGEADHTSCANINYYVPGYIMLIGGALLGLVGVARIIRAVSRPAPAHGRPAVS